MQSAAMVLFLYAALAIVSMLVTAMRHPVRGTGDHGEGPGPRASG